MVQIAVTWRAQMLVNHVAWLILILTSHTFKSKRLTLTNAYSIRSGAKITVSKPVQANSSLFFWKS